MEAVGAKVLWLQRSQPASIRLAMDDPRLEYARAFGSNLVYLRASASIPNQPKLAELVGVSTSTVQRWEAGASLPDAWELIRLGEVLGVDVDDLIHPEPMSERERLLARRAARGVRKGLDRKRRG